MHSCKQCRLLSINSGKSDSGHCASLNRSTKLLLFSHARCTPRRGCTCRNGELAAREHELCRVPNRLRALHFSARLGRGTAAVVCPPSCIAKTIRRVLTLEAAAFLAKGKGTSEAAAPRENALKAGDQRPVSSNESMLKSSCCSKKSKSMSKQRLRRRRRRGGRRGRG